ncbi:MAG: hypothetical protein HUJ86_04160, partial [Synergistes sp.]|nr:hypothetical protein [Synergistes sp.]
MKKLLSALIAAALLILTPTVSSAEKFIPSEPTMPLSKIKPGMTGYAKTVLAGTEIIKFKVSVIGIMPRKTSPKNLILVRILDKRVSENGGIAAGMSGSPVYINGKLIGAIGYGWSFADHDLGLVTPIDDMIKAMDYPDSIPSFEPTRPASEKPLHLDKEKKRDKEAVSGDKEVTSADSTNAASADIKVTSDDETEETEDENDGDENDAPAVSADVKEKLSDDSDSDDEITSADMEISFDIKVISKDVLEKATSADLIEEKMTPLFADGISDRYAKRLEKILNRRVIPLGAAGGGKSPTNLSWKPQPGAAVGVVLAWGDYVMGSIGTLTTLSKDGRFLAFAHPMLEKGASAYGLTDAYIIQIIPSIDNSFKYGYIGKISGIVTQDRPEAIGGKIGRLAPASSYTIKFHDIESEKTEIKRFQTVADPHIGPEIASAGILGMIDNLWGRKGAGTARVSYTISGGSLTPAWTHTNIYYSEKDVVKTMQKEIEALGKILSLNPFREISPYGVNLDVELTKSPRIVYIDKVEIVDEKESYGPGDDVKVDVTFRPWRRRPIVKTFTLTVPEDAEQYCEITARGGGIDEPEQEAVLTGTRAIATFDELISELNASETNNQIIIEIEGPEKDKLFDEDEKTSEEREETSDDKKDKKEKSDEPKRAKGTKRINPEEMTPGDL